jgi:23S rRNA pseudouridine2605 synthase
MDMSELMRINKFLQEQIGISRRQADKLILDGKVLVDNQRATLGQMVDINQQVIVNGQIIAAEEVEKIIVLMNKPAGYICSRKGYQTVYSLLPDDLKYLDYIGRLDVTTTGVLLFTNDGALVNQLQRSELSRVYNVILNRAITREEIQYLLNDSLIDGRKPKLGFIQVQKSMVKIELFEGKHHEVKKIFNSIGIQVLDLHRESFGPVSLKSLKPGEFRLLSNKEKSLLAGVVKKEITRA